MSSENKSDLKKIRLSEWKGMIEREIQDRITEATELRRIINESKTSTKREYYNKKFKKVSNEVLKLVSTLQSITASQPAPVPTPDPTTNLNLTPDHVPEQPTVV